MGRGGGVNARHGTSQDGSRFRDVQKPASATIGRRFAEGWNSVVYGEEFDPAYDQKPEAINYENGRLYAVEVKAACGDIIEPWSLRGFGKWCPVMLAAFRSAAKTPNWSHPVPKGAIR
jgi:hypothetical protein